MAPKILVLTTEPLPLPGVIPTGAGLRAWGLGFGLRSAGFEDVTIAFAADAIRGQNAPSPTMPGVATFERSQLDEFIESQNPDGIVFQHWGLWRELKQRPRCPIAMDLAGPHLLERRLWDSPNPEADLREKLTALSQVDHVVCSGQFQRHYFLPFLIQAGHQPTGKLCPVIPFSLAPGLPGPDPDRARDTFLYAGMFLPWQDPEKPLRALLEVFEEKDRGKLIFLGGAHPSGDVSGGRFDALLTELDGNPRVERRGPMAFDEFIGVMRQCGCAMDLMARNSERELAFPTRTVTYMWGGLPVIHNDFDELAEPLASSKGGFVFDPDDTLSLKKKLRRLLTHGEDLDRASERAQNLVRDQYTWDKTIEPLAVWCRDPKERSDRKAPVIAVTDTIEKSEALPAKKTTKRSSPTVTYAPRQSVTDTERGPWYLSPLVFLLALPISAVLVLLFGFVEVARMITKRS